MILFPRLVSHMNPIARHCYSVLFQSPYITPLTQEEVKVKLLLSKNTHRLPEAMSPMSNSSSQPDPELPAAAPSPTNCTTSRCVCRGGKRGVGWGGGGVEGLG